MTNASPTAAVLVIGNEILSGRTQDVNLSYIAKKLSDCGIRLVEARVVADVEAAIVAAVNALRASVNYVFTTGGIGPTHDDITVASLAKAFGVPVVENAEARERLTSYYTPANLNPARLRMALVPEGARLIDNPVSAAPGFCIGNVYALAGVPNVMQAMFDAALAGLRHGPQIYAVTVTCALPESLLADDLAAVAARFPETDIGSYPSFRMGKIGLAFVARGVDMAKVTEVGEVLRALVVTKGGEPELT